MESIPQPDRDSLVERLQRVPVFQRLDVDVLDRLVRTAIWREYGAGAIVFLEGDMALGFYYVHTGWLKEVKSSPEGREQILQLLGPGEIFNFMGIFVHRPNPATVIALESAGVWLLQRAAFYEALAGNPTLALRVAEALADQVVHLVQLVSDLSLRSVEARLAQRLLNQAEVNVVQRQRWATQAELAAQLGTVPDVLGRALRKLEEERLIRVERHQISILDREGLTAKARLEA
ncbi:MAG TPA: Crp/Fnr family transcriptional regulator [Anaerolineales bacterium]